MHTLPADTEIKKCEKAKIRHVMLEDGGKGIKIVQCYMLLYVTYSPSNMVSVLQVLSLHVSLVCFAINKQS